MTTGEYELIGECKIEQNGKVLVDGLRNRWTDAGLSGLNTILIGNYYINSYSSGTVLSYYYANGAYMAVGTSNTTFNPAQTSLTSQSNSSSVLITSGAGDNLNVLTYVGTFGVWNTPINEIGIYIRMYNNTNAGWTYTVPVAGTGIATPVLIARINATDNASFFPINPDPLYPLVVTWVVRFIEVV